MDDFVKVYNDCKGFLKGCGDVFNFIGKCFDEPMFLIGRIKLFAPGIVLGLVATLIILRILGFENTNKWIALLLILAILIAAI